MTTKDRPVYGYTVQTGRGYSSEYAHIFVKVLKLDYTYTGSDGQEREVWQEVCELRAQAHQCRDATDKDVAPRLRYGFDFDDGGKTLRDESDKYTAWYAFKISDLGGSEFDSQIAAAVEFKALAAKIDKVTAKYNLGYKFPDVVDRFVAGLNVVGAQYVVYDRERHCQRSAKEWEVPYHVQTCK